MNVLKSMHFPKTWGSLSRLGLVAGIAVILALLVSACGDDETPTAAPLPTATPEPETRVRPRQEWTVDNPATRAELEAEIERYRGDQLIFVSWGGAYEGAQKRAYLDNFRDQFGIDLIVDCCPELGKIRSMAETQNVSQHAFDHLTDTIFGLGQVGVLEELDFSVVDNRAFLDSMKTPWGAGQGVAVSTVLAYNPETAAELWGGRIPQSWADFFDIEEFPGGRGLWDNPQANLMIALMAKDPELLKTEQGRKSLFKLSDQQIDEAFQFLDEQREDITTWWTTGSDCPQLLLSGDLAMCSAWNGRIFDAVETGAPLAICWDCGHVINTTQIAIPNGLKANAPRTFELAQLLIAWGSLPEIQAEFSKYITYGPVNQDAVPLLNDPAYDKIRPFLPNAPQHVPSMIIYDELWWGANLDELTERWRALLQK